MKALTSLCFPSSCWPRVPRPATLRSTDSGSPGVGARGDVDGILTIAQGTASGPGISIDEAIGNAGAEPLLVNGALFIDPDGAVLLCNAIAESFPPQCGGTRLEIRGLDLASVPDLEEANGARWAEQVQLLGTFATEG